MTKSLASIDFFFRIYEISYYVWISFLVKLFVLRIPNIYLVELSPLIEKKHIFRFIYLDRNLVELNFFILLIAQI